MAFPGSSFPSVDLTDFDLVPAVRAASKASATVGQQALDLARDATYVSVGLGILTVQRLQVRRRKLLAATKRS